MSRGTGLLDRLAALDSCVVSDALDHLGLSGATTGIRPMWGIPKIVGFARTVEVVDAAAAGDVKGRHLATRTVESSGPEDVVVIANQGRTDVSCWGDILTTAAQERGIRGVVVDGACRDVDAITEAAFPVYARAGVPVTARGRIVERASDVPVSFGGVQVRPNDLVIADASGVVIVPAAHAGEVLAAAERLALRQERMLAAVRSGRSVVEVMADGQFAAALSGRGPDAGPSGTHSTHSTHENTFPAGDSRGSAAHRTGGPA
ncbi:RraA family protein [Streptomyces sp. NPDC048106]|uniref:RraA family protein n=1 Tax=Streptomyces sp. NPDC048106 TaxID=3155750 RepID=UPI0034564A99